jgi:hypothetical protein
MNYKQLKNSTAMQREPYLSENKDGGRKISHKVLILYIHHPPKRSSMNLQPPSNVSKSNSTDEQNTSNPSSHTHTLHAKSSQHEILSFNRVCRSIGCPGKGDVCSVRRGYQVRVDGE